VAVADGVAVGWRVGVPVGYGLAVAVAVGVGVEVAVPVGVGVAVAVPVGVAVDVDVGLGVWVGGANSSIDNGMRLKASPARALISTCPGLFSVSWA
jgi:hypothetical protein